MGAVTLSDKQQRRVQVMERLSAETLTTCEAASLLGVSDRQVRRLRDAYMHSGIPGLVHGNTGRLPTNKTPCDVAEEVRSLCGKDGPYRDFNVCHAQEMLHRHHDLVIGRSTLDRLLKEGGVRSRRRKKSTEKRARRERRASAGQMLQIDGSPHDWLEGRGPRMCLMGAIDDATGKVVYARFHESEDQAGYLMLLRGVCTCYGIPMSVYHDKHTILRSPKEATLDEELCGVKPMSQVQRVMEGLGIEPIAANSPQAKGRVERLWKSLQDRLIREMRLEGVSAMETANAFLPGFLERYNARFTVEPRDSVPAWVKMPEDADLLRLFSTRLIRTVAKDHTVSFEGNDYLLHRNRQDASLCGRKVEVHVSPEGELAIYHGRNRLDHALCQKAVPVQKASPETQNASLLEGLILPPKPAPGAFKNWSAIRPKPADATPPTVTQP